MKRQRARSLPPMGRSFGFKEGNLPKLFRRGTRNAPPPRQVSNTFFHASMERISWSERCLWPSCWLLVCRWFPFRKLAGVTVVVVVIITDIIAITRLATPTTTAVATAPGTTTATTAAAPRAVRRPTRHLAAVAPRAARQVTRPQPAAAPRAARRPTTPPPAVAAPTAFAGNTSDLIIMKRHHSPASGVFFYARLVGDLRSCCLATGSRLRTMEARELSNRLPGYSEE